MKVILEVTTYTTYKVLAEADSIEEAKNGFDPCEDLSGSEITGGNYDINDAYGVVDCPDCGGKGYTIASDCERFRAWYIPNAGVQEVPRRSIHPTTRGGETPMKIFFIDPHAELLVHGLQVSDKNSARHVDEFWRQQLRERGEIDRILVASGMSRIMDTWAPIPVPIPAGRPVR